MHNILFNNINYQCRDNETVLDALQRQGVELSFSCRKGSCQVCMLNCISKNAPVTSQTNLRPVFINKGYFLPCMCKPHADMEIAEIEPDQLYLSAYIHKKEFLSDTVCRLLIECDKLTDFKPGQFINVCRPVDGLVRSYSIASSPEDYYLELHVQLMKNGELSQWIFDELQEEDEIQIQGPNGDCYYSQDNTTSPILLVSTGTGLATAVGILNDAIRNNHQGEIHLYHEVRSKEDLYLDSYLMYLSVANNTFHYFPCVPGSFLNNGVLTDKAETIIHSNYPNLKGWQVFLAGSSKMVSNLTTCAIAKGASVEMIFSDSFDYKDLRDSNTLPAPAFKKRESDKITSSCPFHETGYPEPDNEIWQALDQGKKLTKILTDFYTIVYNDEKLSPFFTNITMQRSIEKVYLFMRQIFTGEKVYIGDRPRNAHHWMVISDELFDYRENIMMGVLRDNNLPEDLIKRWRSIEEKFRPDIVKDKPWNKVINGTEVPVDGYEELELDDGTICDSCNQAIESGKKVRYHVRLGTVYCPQCSLSTADTNA